MLHGEKQEQVVPDMPRNKKVLPDVFPSAIPQFSGVLRFIQQLFQPVSGAIGRVNEDPGLFMGDLQGNPAHGAGDHGIAFPQCLGNSQTESFAQGLLQNDR